MEHLLRARGDRQKSLSKPVPYRKLLSHYLFLYFRPEDGGESLQAVVSWEPTELLFIFCWCGMQLFPSVSSLYYYYLFNFNMLGYAVHHCSVAVKHRPEEVSRSTVGQEGSEDLLLLKGRDRAGKWKIRTYCLLIPRLKTTKSM